MLVLGGVYWLDVNYTRVTNKSWLVNLVLLVTAIQLACIVKLLAGFIIKNKKNIYIHIHP